MRIVSGFLALAFVATSPALAADGVKPPPTVNCVFENFPVPMRDLVHDLFERIGNAGDDPFQNMDFKAAMWTQIDAAQEACLDRYPLGVGQTQSSRDFAYTSLLAEFLGARLKTHGGSPEYIVTYFQAHLAGLPLTTKPTEQEIAAGKARLPDHLPPRDKDDIIRQIYLTQARAPTSQETAALLADLKGKGWKIDDPRMENSVAFYLRMQIQLALDRQLFDDGGPPMRSPPPPRRRKR